MPPDNWVISHAHEWHGNHELKCIRCGVKTVPGQWSLPPCEPHWELKSNAPNS